MLLKQNNDQKLLTLKNPLFVFFPPTHTLKCLNDLIGSYQKISLDQAKLWKISVQMVNVLAKL